MKFVLVLTLASSVAFGGSVSGRVHDGTAGVAGMQVRLWGVGPKGYTFQSPQGAVTTTDGTGNYVFSGVAAGSYKVDTRMPNGVNGNWGDRWYDQVPPVSDGYVMEDADVFPLTASDTLSALDIQVEINGGFDGRAVNPSNGNLGGILSHAESMLDRRVHHNDTTRSDAFWPGLFSFRGLRPVNTRLILHDPTYTFGDTIRANITVTANTAPTVPNLMMSPAPADAREPNNNATATGSGFDASLFRGATPQAFTATGAIGPRSSGDTDWYCFDGEATDRFIVDVGGTLTLEDNTVVPSPWVDSMVSFWRVSPLTKLGEDDDNGPGTAARLDTGELGTAGRYCVVVSTFGDTAWNGTNQTSAGPYALNLVLGNRRPSLTASVGGTPVTMINANEGDDLAITLAFTDPDGNLNGGTFEIRDAQNVAVAGGTFSTTTGTYTVNWTASQTAQRGGPYMLVATVADAEFTTTATVNIVIAGVNVAPTAPRLFSPDSGSTVTTRTPSLACLEAHDVDEETLVYEFELTWGDGGAQGGTVSGIDGGWRYDAGSPPAVRYAATAIPENSLVTWRARAFDGVALNGYSVWSAEWTFFVDSINDPPGTPVLNKPTDGEELPVRRATLESTNPADPEGEAVTLSFEVATDVTFNNVVVNSGPVPTTVGSLNTLFTVPMELDWGTTYFGRVTATDARGASSPRSNVNEFRIRMNSSPMPPVLSAPFAACGVSTTFNLAPVEVTVANVGDVEMDTINVEAKLFRATDDPLTATALFSQTVTQQGLINTTFSLAGVQWMEDTQYRLRVRFLDGFNMTAWTECVFTLDAMMTGTGGGSGTGGGVATGGGSATGGGAATGGGIASGGGTATGGGSTTGGGEGGGEGGGAGGGGDVVAKPGCGCTSVDPLAPLALLLGLALRRRRATR